MTAWCVYDVAGRSWVKMKRYQANVKEQEHRHPSFKRSGSTQRNWRQRKVMRQYESSWNNRCRFLFCCVHNSESNRDSFGDLAKLLSEFFRDLDVVPSDIIVGLLLLRKLQRLEQVSIINEKRNNTYEFLSGIAITPNTKFVAMNDAQDLEAYHNVVYYMRYSSAAYGWLWYVIPNGFRGLFNLCSNVKCCFHRYLCNSLGQELSERVVEDNCCFCNVAVIPTMFDPSSFEIVYATYHVDVGETPFFVVVDYEKQAIVVSIRGTLSLKDLMTDLNAEAEPLPLHPVKEDWLGHKGMVQAAAYLKSKLIGENILERAFEMCQARSNEIFNVVIVGHSLGGGAAAILAILLREQFPDLVCYAYSPPGGLLSMPAVEYTKEFVTSVIVGKDLVPRIGLSQMEALRADLLNAIKKSHTPKWRTIMAGVKCCRCFGKSEFATPNDRNSSPAGGNENSSASFNEDLLGPNDSIVSMMMHRPLYPPGRIMHVVRHHVPNDRIKYESVWRRIVGKGEPVFQAIWTDNTDYDEVLISPGMIQDHLPDKVLKALNRVTTSLGPAKPHRAMTNSASPMINESSLGGGGDFIEHSSKQHSGASFASEASGSCARHDEPPIKAMTSTTTTTAAIVSVSKPSPPARSSSQKQMMLEDDVLPADEDVDEYISVAGSHSTETLFSLKINWDIFKELGKHPLKLSRKNSHTRTSSSGSSTCSELGTTMKEIFGPIKLYECTVPLASSETLGSDISSMSSRASFIIRDRSPLTKLKLGKNLSLRVHESNGNGNGRENGFETLNEWNGKSHQRSLSCVYPEGKGTKNLLNPYGTLNGSSKDSPPPQDTTDETTLTKQTNGNYDTRNNNNGHHSQQQDQQEFYASNPDFDPQPDADQTPTGDEMLPEHSYLEQHDVEFGHGMAMGGFQEQFAEGDEEEEDNAGGGEFAYEEEEEDDEGHPSPRGSDASSPVKSEDGFGRNRKQVPTHQQGSSRRGGRGEGDSDGQYSPVYPSFASQQEYGREDQSTPHYSYATTSQSPVSSVHSQNNGNN
ncbi:sn1-specific diacylglycerol lipase alpha isoform X3 [Folsomia candida]|nr:sn1-specific diacylglycerol lipase alpha isoform X3 [Folsomia candida]